MQLAFLSVFLAVIAVTVDTSPALTPAPAPHLGNTGPLATNYNGRIRRSAEEVNEGCICNISTNRRTLQSRDILNLLITFLPFLQATLEKVTKTANLTFPEDYHILGTFCYR